MITMVRVTVLIALASLVWTPIGVYVGMRPHLSHVVQPVAQFLAAFPANLLFPGRRVRDRALLAQSRHRAVAADGAGHAVVHPVQRHRRRRRDPARIARRGRAICSSRAGCGGARWRCRRCFPSTSPARSPRRADRGTPASWPRSQAGARTRCAPMGSAPISPMRRRPGDFHRIVLGIATMSFFVVVVNRLFWRPLYWFAERRYRLT